MKLSDRNLGYLVLGGLAFFLLLFLSASNSRKSQDVPPAPQVVSTPAPPAVSPSSLPPIPRETYLSLTKTISQMKDAGLLDYFINPEGGAALVFVEPRCWNPMLHKDKVTFVGMFIGFFHGYNQDHPGSGEVPFFIIKNISTKKRLARGWVKIAPPDTDSRVEIFQ